MDSLDTPSLESFHDLSEEEEVEVELQPLTEGGGHTSELIIVHQTSNNSRINLVFEPNLEGSQVVE